MVSNSTLAMIALLVAGPLHCSAQSGMSHSTSESASMAKPLMLERNEGEARTRRPRPKPSPTSQFMLKVDPMTNGSQHFVVGTEDIGPGASIPIHKHPAEDELLFIQSGRAHVWLGNQERDLHAGGIVFIPANTWIGMKNTSDGPVSVTFVFSAPGFEQFQRCISVPAGTTPTPMSEEDLKRCEAPGHMVYK